MGELFKVMAICGPGWPEPAGFARMSVTFRLAGTDDAPSLSVLGAETFTETFGHLYDPGDLALFLTNHDEEQWRQELADPEFAVLIVEDDGEAIGYAKIGPPHLPFEPRGTAVELGNSICSSPGRARAWPTR